MLQPYFIQFFQLTDNYEIIRQLDDRYENTVLVNCYYDKMRTA